MAALGEGVDWASRTHTLRRQVRVAGLVGCGRGDVVAVGRGQEAVGVRGGVFGHLTQVADHAVLHGEDLAPVVHVADRHAPLVTVYGTAGSVRPHPLVADAAHALCAVFPFQEVGEFLPFALQQ